MLRKVYGANAELPTSGELHGELLRLYSSALDNLALAEAGVLIRTDQEGQPVHKVSNVAVSRAISEARKLVGDISALAANATSEAERPTGLAHGDLSARIEAQLRMVIEEGHTMHDHALERPHSSDSAALDCIEAEVVAPSSGPTGTPGGVVGDGGDDSTPQ